jgi:hypothetical protein
MAVSSVEYEDDKEHDECASYLISEVLHNDAKCFVATETKMGKYYQGAHDLSRDNELENEMLFLF